MGSRKTAGTAKNERLVRDKEDGRWDEERGRGGKEQGGTQSREGVAVEQEQEQKGRRRGGGGKLWSVLRQRGMMD